MDSQVGGAHAVRVLGTVHPTYDPLQLEPPHSAVAILGLILGVPAWGEQTRRARPRRGRVLACLHQGGSGVGVSITLPSSPRGRAQPGLALGAAEVWRGAGLGQAWAGPRPGVPELGGLGLAGDTHLGEKCPRGGRLRLSLISVSATGLELVELLLLIPFPVSAGRGRGRGKGPKVCARQEPR